MILNSKQAAAKTIPSNVRISKITMSSSLKVFMILMGVPSGGTPSVYYGQTKFKSNIVFKLLTRIDIIITETRYKTEGIVV